MEANRPQHLASPRSDMDLSREIRSPMAGNNRQYNRNKFYSALKTGFMHMNDEKARASFL